MFKRNDYIILIVILMVKAKIAIIERFLFDLIQTSNYFIFNSFCKFKTIRFTMFTVLAIYLS